jgi:hypothetical protein
MTEISKELYEFYPNMSAQTHESLVKEYASKAVRSALSAKDAEADAIRAQLIRMVDIAESRLFEIERLRSALAWVRVNYASAPTQQINAHIDDALNGGSDAP